MGCRPEFNRLTDGRQLTVQTVQAIFVRSAV